MTIRCPECGYENRDMYRFCGMCGATLRREPAAAPPSAPAPVSEPVRQRIEPSNVTPQVAEPAPASSLDYLLEDEPPKSRGKLYLTLLLLIVAGGVIAWHWAGDRRGSAAAEPPATSAPAAASAPTATQATPPSSVQTPLPTPKPEAPAPKPSNSQPTMVASASPAETPATPPTKSAEDESAKTPDEDAASAQPAESEATPPTTAPDANEPAPAMTAPPTPAPKPKPEVKVASPPTPVLKGDDKLVAEGEKYLYGNGVPENCDLAQKNLKLAAAHANAHALTLMGAMYATGHCVDRDLPTAYRWFAKALRQDPSNARVQQDLEILWKQMTPGEKQLATKSGG